MKFQLLNFVGLCFLGCYVFTTQSGLRGATDVFKSMGGKKSYLKTHIASPRRQPPNQQQKQQNKMQIFSDLKWAQNPTDQQNDLYVLNIHTNRLHDTSDWSVPKSLRLKSKDQLQQAANGLLYICSHDTTFCSHKHKLSWRLCLPKYSDSRAAGCQLPKLFF